MIKIIKTSDGSNSLYSEQFDEHYHSIFGAVNESMHIFIHEGLNKLNITQINIFEVGFGSGLNAFLTLLEGKKRNLVINYTTIEKYPINEEIYTNLNYPSILSKNDKLIFDALHKSPWNSEIIITNKFKLNKINADFNQYIFDEKYDLIYFDAFAPEKQPDLWSQENFNKIFMALKNKGILTTYSSKGIVKRNLRNAGFTVERLKGPIGKRHIIRAIKSIEEYI